MESQSLASVVDQVPPILPNPSGCQLGLPINDNSCNSNHQFQIQVLNAPGALLGQNVYLREVRLIIRHDWDADLDIHLTSPSGKVVEISTDNGTGDDNYGNPFNGLCDEFTAFIANSLAEACNTPNIKQGHPPFTGQYLPEGNFSDFNDGTAANGLWTLQVCDDGSQNYGTLEFVELVFDTLICNIPSDLSLLAIDSVTATLDWAEGGNCAQTIIEYGPPGFTPGIDSFAGQGFVVYTGCPPITLENLTTSTDYDIYIREYCGGGVFSANSCVFSVSTFCTLAPATLQETFNDQSLCSVYCPDPCLINGVWTNATTDNFDWIVHAGPTGTPATGPNDDVPGGGKYAYIESSPSCYFSKKASLVSNCIEVHANPACFDLSFNYFMYGSQVQNLSLEITNNGGMTWTTLWNKKENQGDKWLIQFIELDAYEGQTVQFRFVGEGGNGPYGDIAIDNITFYGSLDLGFPGFVYFLDEDMDGYGTPDVFVASCSPITLPGFVLNGGDCNDSAPWINPGAAETPCDNEDANCNGMDDEFILPPLEILNDTVCSGAIGELVAMPYFGGTIYWYDAETGGNLLDEGDSYSPPDFPVNNSDNPLNLVFFAEEITYDSCVSANRTKATITILPQPALTAIDTQEICAGKTFDLNTLDIVDINGANGQITFHSSLPPAASNQIANIITPQANTPYYIVSTSNGGCRDIASVNFKIKPSPVAFIEGDTTLCFGSSQALTAIDIGNGESITYEWNKESNDSFLNTNSNAIKGATDLYSVTITGSNGCSSADTILVKTITTIDSVQTSIQAVTTCNGDNGSITISPLNGTPPFTYEWDDNLIANQPGPLTVNNLMQGTYSFTITDGSMEGCSYNLPLVVVNGPSAVVEVKRVTPVSCAGGNNGCIELEVIGNSPSILWSTGATTALLCGLSAGTYTVTVTEGNCPIVLPITVPEPEHLKVFPAIQDESCLGKHDGKITLNVFGGTPPYQFNWSNGQLVKTIANLSAGPYSVTVTDAMGCQLVLQDIIVKDPPPISINPTPTLPQCFNFQNGEIAIQVAGGNAPYTTAWSTGGTGSIIANLAAGAYTVSVTDSKGCMAAQTINLGEPPPISFQVDAVTHPTCNGVNDGSIATSTTGGNGGFSFNWGVSNSQNPTNIGQGCYVVTITDQLGCTFVSDSVCLTGPKNLDISASIGHPPCEGVDSGFIEVTVNGGGEAPYEFFWNTDESQCCLYGLGEGEYCTTIIDGNGCIFDTCFLLVTQQPIVILDLDTIHPSCFGMPNGQICMVVGDTTSGLGPFDIAWSNGTHGDCISNLFAGNYAATITAANDCRLDVDIITLEEPSQLAIKVENVEGIACFGNMDGAIDVTLSGGVLPYNISWSNGAKTEDLSGLTEGSYTLTLTDANNCVVVSDPLQIAEPDTLIPFSNIVLPGGCEQSQMTTVCADATGGTLPYQFFWSTGDTTSCLDGAQPGDYHVTVTDAAGCTQELMSVKVFESFSPISLNMLDDVHNVSCPGQETGELAIQIEGGLAPFNYIWSNGVTGFSIEDTLINTNLGAGTYNVTITDNAGCVAVSEWAEVTSNPLMQLAVPNAQLQHVKCKGNQDGAIDLNITGGQPPFDIAWTDSNSNFISNQEDIQNLGAGTYTVRVYDSDSCYQTINVTITEPDEGLSLLNPPPQLTHESCFGYHNGKIDLTVTGGVTPYTYHWSNDDTTEDLSGLPPGQYAVTVTDANTCAIQSIFYTVDGPGSPLSLQTSTVEDVDCFGFETGAIEITMHGGTFPYAYNWISSNNEIFVDEDLLNVAAGTYQLTVFDSNACAYDTVLVIDQPDSLFVLASSTPANPGQNNGTAAASAEGGTPPYSYVWSDGQAGQTATELQSGWYAVTATDASFCETVAYVFVDNVSSTSTINRNIRYSVYPNPTSGKTVLLIEASNPVDLEMSVYNALGSIVAGDKRNNAVQEKISFDLTGQPSGLYFIVGSMYGQRLFTEKLVLLNN